MVSQSQKIELLERLIINKFYLSPQLKKKVNSQTFNLNKFVTYYTRARPCPPKSSADQTQINDLAFYLYSLLDSYASLYDFWSDNKDEIEQIPRIEESINFFAKEIQSISISNYETDETCDSSISIQMVIMLSSQLKSISQLK